LPKRGCLLQQRHVSNDAGQHQHYLDKRNIPNRYGQRKHASQNSASPNRFNLQQITPVFKPAKNSYLTKPNQTAQLQTPTLTYPTNNNSKAKSAFTHL
jgi:hypothetical protein